VPTMSDSLVPLFRPSRVAVVGASSNPEKMGFQIFRNIVEAGFQGEILPVNPKGETVLGKTSLKSAAELPEGTDLAVLIIPAKLVPGTILQLGERKVRSAIVISGGFAESGDAGAAIQEEMARGSTIPTTGFARPGPSSPVEAISPSYRKAARWARP